MSGPVEIPLLRESAAFARRLVAAARAFAEPAYFFHRRVNWSHRYSEHFYACEAACFRAAPDDYLAGRLAAPPELPDVYRQTLRPRQVAVQLAKVAAHWLFLVCGRLAGARLRGRGLGIYRKAYVDDIELVFDPAQPGVLRAVYPFPLNVRRQLAYLADLRRTGRPFQLAGLPYLGADVLRFAARRDVASLMRMESRAQIRHAAQVAALGMREVQLSDEFDIGSLDFARRLSRAGLRVVNSAHGVGKYLPVHAYREFHVLTRRQQDYYHAIGACRYRLRRLNERAGAPPAPAHAHEVDEAPRRVDLVVLGQTFDGVSEIIGQNEQRLLARLRQEFGPDDGLRLFYKPHPNRKAAAGPAGFRRLDSLQEVNGRAGTVFASFFSTCQIDPAFKGRKVLVRGPLIHPEIAFDDSETVVDDAGLVALVRGLTRAGAAAAAPSQRVGTVSTA